MKIALLLIGFYLGFVAGVNWRIYIEEIKMSKKVRGWSSRF